MQSQSRKFTRISLQISQLFVKSARRSVPVECWHLKNATTSIPRKRLPGVKQLNKNTCFYPWRVSISFPLFLISAVFKITHDIESKIKLNYRSTVT